MSNTNVKVDKFALILYLLLGIIGSLVLFRFSQNNRIEGVQRQLFAYFPLSLLVLMVFVKRGDVDIFRNYENTHFLISTILLSLVLIFGVEFLVAKRSLNLGFASFQPSYYSRIILINSLAICLSSYDNLIVENKLGQFLKKSLKLVIFYAITAFLILKEPHFSVLLITSVAMFFLIFLAGL